MKSKVKSCYRTHVYKQFPQRKFKSSKEVNNLGILTSVNAKISVTFVGTLCEMLLIVAKSTADSKIHDLEIQPDTGEGESQN